MYREENNGYLSETDDETKIEFMNKARNRFEIKVFMEVE